MAQNISLLGANYSAVPSVTLPKTGGGTASFTDVTDTTATASDVASGKYFYTSSGVRTQGTSSGGGASNFVMGTFTTGNSRRKYTGHFTIPYTGTGYLIALTIYVKGGAYNNTSSGNTTWYNSVNRYDVGWYSMVKSRITSAPNYSSNAADNWGTVAIIYKNSTSSATTYTRTSSMSAYVYAPVTQGGQSTDLIKLTSDGKTVYYGVGNNTSSTIAFPPSTEMEYIAVYSS